MLPSPRPGLRLSVLPPQAPRSAHQLDTVPLRGPAVHALPSPTPKLEGPVTCLVGADGWGSSEATVLHLQEKPGKNEFGSQTPERVCACTGECSPCAHFHVAEVCLGQS